MVQAAYDIATEPLYSIFNTPLHNVYSDLIVAEYFIDIYTQWNHTLKWLSHVMIMLGVLARVHVKLRHACYSLNTNRTSWLRLIRPQTLRPRASPPQARLRKISSNRRPSALYTYQIFAKEELRRSSRKIGRLSRLEVDLGPLHQATGELKYLVSGCGRAYGHSTGHQLQNRKLRRRKRIQQRASFPLQ